MFYEIPIYYHKLHNKNIYMLKASHWIPIHKNSVIKSHKICYKMWINLHDIKYNIYISDMSKTLIIKQLLGIKKNVADHIQITPLVFAAFKHIL